MTGLLRVLDNEPHVSQAGFANYLPMSRGGAANRFEIEGRAETRVEDQKFSWVSIVGGRYFEAMGIPLLGGRLPGREDTDTTEPVFVIDEALARRYWPNADPVGAHLTWHRDEQREMDRCRDRRRRQRQISRAGLGRSGKRVLVVSASADA